MLQAACALVVLRKGHGGVFVEGAIVRPVEEATSGLGFGGSVVLRTVGISVKDRLTLPLFISH